VYNRGIPIRPEEGYPVIERKRTEIVQVNLRLRESLRRRLKREAEENNCTFNQEMVRRLEQSFQQQDQAAREAALLARLDEMAQKNDRITARLDEVQDVFTRQTAEVMEREAGIKAEVERAGAEFDKRFAELEAELDRHEGEQS
jgi:hypothetical protein